MENKGTYFNPLTCNVAGHEFSLKEFKEINGHDDSLPYEAILCCDGKPLCSVLNDGWGGPTNVMKIYNKKAYSRISEEIENKQYPISPWDIDMFGTEILEFSCDDVCAIADYLAENYANLYSLCDSQSIVYYDTTDKKFKKYTFKGQVTDNMSKSFAEKQLSKHIIIFAPHLHQNF